MLGRGEKFTIQPGNRFRGRRQWRTKMNCSSTSRMKLYKFLSTIRLNRAAAHKVNQVLYLQTKFLVLSWHIKGSSVCQVVAKPSQVKLGRTLLPGIWRLWHRSALYVAPTSCVILPAQRPLGTILIRSALPASSCVPTYVIGQKS